jgi:tetratricopeptide (TPR) repeat protein
MGLEDLVDKALVQFDDTAGRYRLLETVRSYAKDALDETLEADSVRDRHLAYFKRFTLATEPHINGPDAKAFLEGLDEEHENLRAAIDWGSKGGDVMEALGLAASLSTYYQVRGMFEEGCNAYASLLRIIDDERHVYVADAFAAQGTLLFRQGQFGSTRQQVGKAVEIYELLGDVHGTARALNTLAVVALQLKEYEVAAPLFERSLGLFKQLGEERRIAMALNNLGILSLHLGDLAKAKRLYEEALEVNRRSGNQRFEAGNLTNLADVELRGGNIAKARDLARRACALHLEVADMQNLQESFEVLAAAELRSGRPYVAAILFANKEALMTELGLTIAPFVADEYKRNVESTQQALGEETFRAAYTEGRSMTPDEAFKASLEDF